MTIQYDRARDPKDYFTGYSFFKARTIADRFDIDPAKITPLELIEWALIEGEWYLGCDSSGSSVWYGPCGDSPMPGQNKSMFHDLKDTLEEMVRQYVCWWRMRTAYDTAMSDYSAKTAKEFLAKLKAGNKKITPPKDTLDVEDLVDLMKEAGDEEDEQVRGNEDDEDDEDEDPLDLNES